MKKFLLLFLVVVSFAIQSEIRIITGNSRELQEQSEQLSRVIANLRSSGYFQDKLDLKRDEILDLLDEGSGLITTEGKSYLIIDSELIDKIQFSESKEFQKYDF